MLSMYLAGPKYGDRPVQLRVGSQLHPRATSGSDDLRKLPEARHYPTVIESNQALKPDRIWISPL